jgi:hypothetical protein
VVSVLALAVAWRAEAADLRDEARARLRAGVALMEQGDYAAALAAFEEAYALVPNPKLQFNIGTAQDALARRAAAYEAFTLFLADPRDAPAETVARARTALAVLEKKVGRIAVTSDAADDKVFIDGRPRGTTPLPRPIVVDAGAHAVTITRGEAQFTENVTLAEGEERAVVARFAPPAVPPVTQPETTIVPRVAETTPPETTLATKPAPPPPPPPETRPFYGRPWFWLLVGGAAAAGVAGAFLLRGTEYPASDDKVTIP